MINLKIPKIKYDSNESRRKTPCKAINFAETATSILFTHILT